MNVFFCGKTENPITSCILHQHDCWEIILQTSGEAIAQVNNLTYTLNKGNIIIIPPNTLHRSYSNEPYTDIYMQCYHLDNSLSQVSSDQNDTILMLLNLLHKTFVEREKNYKQICDNIYQLICDFLDKYHHSHKETPFVSDLKNKFYNNISTINFSVANAISDTGFNPDYVRRYFKAETGMTPLEYFTNMKLSYSKRLLLQDSYINIVDVAEKCGYNDSFYFSRVFKKRFGISPLNYRISKKK